MAGEAFVVILSRIAVPTILVSGPRNGIDKTLGGDAGIGHLGQAVGPSCITVGVGKLVDHAKGAGGNRQAPTGMALEVPVIIVAEV